MNRIFIAFGALFTGALPFLMDATFKSAGLLLVAAASVMFLRKASAATRHFVWLLAVGALLVLPAFSALLPRWTVLPSLVPAVERSAFHPDKTFQSHLDPAAVIEVEVVAIDAAAIQPIASKKSFPVRDWLPLVWMAGVALWAMRLAAAQWSLGWVEKRCRVVQDGRLAEAIQDTRRQLNIRRPVQLLLDSRGRIPMTWGIFRPRVLLPADAVNWDDTRLRAVLLHELAHIKRGDPVVQWLVQASCALHWFNPLVWLAAWRLRVESERACDDLVLANGVRASDYAEHLLQIATTLSPTRMAQPCGLFMARPAALEGRLLAILNQRANRRRLTRACAFATLALGFGVLIPVAMLRAAPEKMPDDTAVEGSADMQKNTNEPRTNTVISADTDSKTPSAPAAKPATTESMDASSNEVNQVKLLHAKSDLDRATQLYEKRLISEEEFNRAKTELEIARAEFAGRQDQVTQIRLKDAEKAAARMAELQKLNVVSKEALDEAKYKLDLLRADAKGDASEAARVRFREAEREFARASELEQKKVISEDEYNEAKKRFDLWQAEFRQHEINDSAAASSSEEMRTLLKARDEAWAKVEAGENKLQEAGKGSRLNALGFATARRSRDLQAESGSKREAYKHYAEIAREMEKKIQEQVDTGARPLLDADIARFERLQAEVDLARVEGRLPVDKK